MKKFLSKTLAIVLMLSIMAPLSQLISAAAETEEPFNYTLTSFSKEELMSDNWVVTKNDGTSIVTQDENVFTNANDGNFYWRFNDDGSVQGQGSTDCEANFGKARQSLTYVGKWLKDFNVSFSTNYGEYNHRVSFSIGVQNPGEYYNDENSPKNVITFTTNPQATSNKGLYQLQIKGAALKNGTEVVNVYDSNGKYNFDVKVLNGILFFCCNNFSCEFELNENYTGGYFQLTSPNSYAKFYPPTIDNMVQSETGYKVFSYSDTQMNSEGWVQTSNDGTDITTYDSVVVRTHGSSESFFWRPTSTANGQSIVSQGNDCENLTGKQYQNLTYTGKEFKDFNLKFKTGASGWHAGAGFSLGVKKSGELYLGDGSPDNVITVMTGPVTTGDITSFTIGGAALASSAQTLSVTKDSNNQFNWDVTVLNKILEIKCNDKVFTFVLNDNYVGGYIQLTSPYSYSSFSALTVETVNLSVDASKGDVNLDGTVNAEDLALLKKVLLGKASGYCNSDVNGDGSVDIIDMVSLKKKLVIIGIPLVSETADFTKLLSDGYVKTLGRAGIVDGEYHMAHVNSGFEITGIFEGNVVMTGHRDIYVQGREDFVNIIVDGKLRTVWCDYSSADITLATGLEKGIHTIRVEKAYSISSGAYVPTAVKYTGALEKPANTDKLTIEVLGDSMTDGIGTATVKGNDWDSANGGNNSYYSYAAVMARELDAELSCVSLAGEGITNIHENYYPYISHSQKGNYAFTEENQKDIVLINLGTNGVYDYNTYDECTDETIKEAAYNLLVDVRKNNPNAYIAWVNGMMSKGAKWSDAYKAAIADMKDDKIFDIDVTDIYGSAVSGLDNLHPDRTQYEVYGKYIANYIKNKLQGKTVYDASYLSASKTLSSVGRAMTWGDEYIMDYMNSGFSLKGELEGDVTAEFNTNRIGSLLNISIDGGENKVVDVNLNGKTVLAEGLTKGTHTIEVTSGTSMRYTEADDSKGILRLKKLNYNGKLLESTSDKKLSITFLGDSITCGQGLDTSKAKGYQSSNAYYSYAAVLGRSLNANIDVVGRCGAKTNLFAWNSVSGEKGPVDGVDWLTSVNLLGTAVFDYAKHQPDVVVINLGTNDPQTGDDNKWFYEGNGNAVETLLNRVHGVYPQAKIVWTLGMMSDGSENALGQIENYKNAVSKWATDKNAQAYFCDLSSVSDRTGHESHPTIEGHAKAAAALEEFMLENSIISK